MHDLISFRHSLGAQDCFTRAKERRSRETLVEHRQKVFQGNIVLTEECAVWICGPDLR